LREAALVLHSALLGLKCWSEKDILRPAAAVVVYLKPRILPQLHSLLLIPVILSRLNTYRFLHPNIFSPTHSFKMQFKVVALLAAMSGMTMAQQPSGAELYVFGP